MSERIEQIINNVNSLGERLNRKITLVAASKNVPYERLLDLPSLGICDFGENKVQEYLAKCDFVKQARWHIIGNLQRNKLKYIVGQVELIQSVNSLELLTAINDLAQKRAVVQKVLIEVNISAETTKQGADRKTVELICAEGSSLKGVDIRGLMAIPAVNAPNSDYIQLKTLFDELSALYEFDTLSVGMSADYERAIEFGSNMVRLGTVLFGERY